MRIKTKKPYRFPKAGPRKSGPTGVSSGPRVCITFTDQMFNRISRMSVVKNRSFAETVRKLLENVI